jgi:hypothetical protein
VQTLKRWSAVFAILGTSLMGGPSWGSVEEVAPLSVGLGGFAVNLFKSVSASPEAATQAISTVYPSLILTSSLPLPALGPGWSAQFAAGFSPIGISASDEGISRRVLWFSPLVARDLGPVLVRGGVSAWMTLYSSSRGTVTLNNGNSTDRYYIPSSGDTTRVLAFQLGATAPVSSSIDLSLDLLMAGAFSSSRRTMAGVLAVMVPLWF